MPLKTDTAVYPDPYPDFDFDFDILVWENAVIKYPTQVFFKMFFGRIQDKDQGHNLNNTTQKLGITRNIGGVVAFAVCLFVLVLLKKAEKQLKYFAKPNLFFDARG